MHLADAAAAARNGLSGSLGMSHNMLLISLVGIIKQIG
jgi:hypothetical protein